MTDYQNQNATETRAAWNGPQLSASQIFDAVFDAVDWHFSDAEEIGTSDVSAAVHTAIRSLGGNPATESADVHRAVRGLVYAAIRARD